MLSIKDYLVLRKIDSYLSDKLDEEIKENNGFSNKPVEQLTELKNGIENIISKLEEE